RHVGLPKVRPEANEALHGSWSRFTCPGASPFFNFLCMPAVNALDTAIPRQLCRCKGHAKSSQSFRLPAEREPREMAARPDLIHLLQSLPLARIRPYTERVRT